MRVPAVAVMAKVPVPGAVKTRLGHVLGAAAACDLYRAFVGDLDERLATLGHPVLWYHWPEDSAFAGLVTGAKAVVAQHGRDLGERMAAAFDDAFARGFAPVVMLGADVPHVPLSAVSSAIVGLSGRETGLVDGDLADVGGVAGIADMADIADIVVGPAADGGYYLLGLRQPTPGIFRDIEWGGARVHAATIDRARAQGLLVRELAAWFDLDEVQDLERLMRELENDRSVRLPRTSAALAAMGLALD
jgi:glycosyltransferase A (GT-A) superfamily protein (DUF2064 family)